MAPKKKALGKGLGALFQEKSDSNSSQSVLEIDIDSIRPNKDQVRKTFDAEKISELAESIQKHGLLEPVILKKIGNDYLIVAGERRYRAFKLLNLKKIPAIIKDLEDTEIRKLSLIENIQRENLNPIEEAMSYKELLDELNMTQEELSRELGKSRSHIANCIRLLKMEKSVIEDVKNGDISFGIAKVISSLPHKEQISVRDRVKNLGLNVRDTEKLVKEKKNTDFEKNIYIKEIEDELSDKFMTRVRLDDRKGRGKIVIEYFSSDELDRILSEMNKIWN